MAYDSDCSISSIPSAESSDSDEEVVQIMGMKTGDSGRGVLSTERDDEFGEPLKTASGSRKEDAMSRKRDAQVDEITRKGNDDSQKDGMSRKNDAQVDEITTKGNDDSQKDGMSRNSDAQVDEITRKGNDDSQKDDMDIFQNLCVVLDIKFSSKLDEMDFRGVLTPGFRLRLQDEINKLKKTKARRFNELRMLGQELMEIWTTNHVTLTKRVNLVVLYAVINAKSADEVIGEKFLSGSLINKVRDEIKEVKKKVARKYSDKKKKLQKLMSDTYLVPSDIDFNPDATDENLHEALRGIKEAIQDVKNRVLERKELILIIDSIKIALDNLWPLENTKGLIDQATQLVRKMKIELKETHVAFNGEDVSVVLQNFRTVADSLHFEAAGEQNELSPHPSKTRGGASFKPESAVPKGSHVPEGTHSETIDNCLRWLKVDRRSMLNVSYDVQNLKNAIEYYTKGLGMSILRRVGGTGDTCTEVYLGFESAEFSVHINQGDSEQVFGLIKVSVANVLKVIGNLKSLDGCGPVHDPRSIGSSIVSHTHDRNGSVLELVETKTSSNMIQGIIIYVTDLEISIKFYVKVLGMVLIKHKDNTCILGYDNEDSSGAVLELRMNGESITGHTYKLTIRTDDITYSTMVTETLCAEFGGNMKEQSGSVATEESVSVFDPDGLELVLVSRVAAAGSGH